MASRTPIASLRGFLAALMVLIGVLHLVVADSRGSDWGLEGIALAIAGVAGIALGVAMTLARGRAMLACIAVLSTGVIVALVVTRTSGYPFGPFRNATAPVGAFEVLVLVCASLALSSSAVSLILDRLEPPGWRFDTLAPLAIVVAAVPGLAVSSWTDDAAYFAGAAHVHGSTLIGSSNQSGFAYRAELTFGERRQLGDELLAARSAALSTPTLGDALAAGWTTVGGQVPGAGQMVIDIDRRIGAGTFDPAAPAALLFASSDVDAPVVAVQYEAWSTSTTPPAGFTGQDMYWHLHTGTCLVDSIRVVYDEPHVGASCELVDGKLTSTLSWMIRAWVVPGWENPNGTFAHDHPGLR